MSNTRTASDGSQHAETDNPAIESGMSRDTFNLPQNVIMDGIRDYSAQDQDDLLWLAGFTRSELRNSRAALCAELECDWTTALRVFTGKYGAGIGKFMGRVRNVRAKEGRRGSGYIESIVSRKIFSVLDNTRDRHSIAQICGKARRGKTEAVREWQRRNNHGRAIYIDCPVLGGVRALLDEIARRAGINLGRKSNDIASRLERSFDTRHVIIVDECARLLPESRGHNVKPVEFLRRLHDNSGVGLAFVSTGVFRREMESGALAEYLEQLLGRMDDTLFIPDKCGLQEAGDYCRAFNADADVDLIRLAQRIANGRGGLGVLFTLIRQASALADHKKQPLGVEHLAAAQALRDNLHRWPEE